MVTDQQALLASITADFENDEIKRVYADWLEENGKAEQAELIRVQLELKRMTALRTREYQLLDYLKQIPGDPGISPINVRYQDGLIVELSCNWYEFRNVVPKLFVDHPIMMVKICDAGWPGIKKAVPDVNPLVFLKVFEIPHILRHNVEAIVELEKYFGKKVKVRSLDYTGFGGVSSGAIGFMLQSYSGNMNNGSGFDWLSTYGLRSG